MQAPASIHKKSKQMFIRRSTAYSSSHSHVRKLSWSISIHFIAIHSWSVHRSRKSRKNH